MSLIVEGVHHRYRATDPPVLAGVALRAEPGQAVALVGPSGSGKTTLLAICGGLLVPRAGEVTLHGAPMARCMLRAQVSWVFQGTNALLARTVLDNVVVRGLAQGHGRRAATAEGLARLAAVGLADRADRTAGTLSGGELQRVCVARALMGDPALVCADEPSGQLDAAATDAVVRSLLGSRGRRAIVLIATHDPRVATACDRVVELADGLLEAAP